MENDEVATALGETIVAPLGGGAQVNAYALASGLVMLVTQDHIGQEAYRQFAVGSLVLEKVPGPRAEIPDVRKVRSFFRRGRAHVVVLRENLDDFLPKEALASEDCRHLSPWNQTWWEQLSWLGDALARGDTSAVLKLQGRQRFGPALTRASQAYAALKQATGLIATDWAPSNLGIKRDGTVVVRDWGRNRNAPEWAEAMVKDGRIPSL